NSAVCASSFSISRRTPSGIGYLPSSQWRTVRSETPRYLARAALDRPRNSRTTFNSAGVIRSTSGTPGGSMYLVMAAPKESPRLEPGAVAWGSSASDLVLGDDRPEVYAINEGLDVEAAVLILQLGTP